MQITQQYFTIGSSQNLAKAKPFEFFFELGRFCLRQGLPFYEMKKNTGMCKMSDYSRSVIMQAS